MFSRLPLLCCLLSLGALLAGCETMQPKVEVAPAQPVRYVQAEAPAAVPTGGLFRPAAYRPGFEDPRARLPGDLVTIQITERVTASQSTSASIDRSADVSAGIAAFPLLKSGTLGKLDVGAQSSNSFAGDGKNAANNTFSGTIDPRQIRPGNVVASTQVANARIESVSRGAQGEAMSIGWLARFFLSVLPF